MKESVLNSIKEQIDLVKKSIEWCKVEIEEGRDEVSKLKYLQGQEVGLIRAYNKLMNYEEPVKKTEKKSKMITLNDLTYKPDKDITCNLGRFTEMEVEKQFHFSSICLNLLIECNNETYSFFSLINLGEEYLANIINLIFELFRDHMSNDWEKLNFDMIKDKIIFSCIFDSSDNLIAIGYKGEWINQKEVLNLLKERRENE